MSIHEEPKTEVATANPEAHNRRLSPIEQELREAQTRIAELEDKTKQLEEENQGLAERAIKDPLTGVFNRAGLEARLSAVDEEIKKHPELFSNDAVYLIMADADHFKDINDEYGHSTGDTALKAFAETLVASVREYDTVCRWGGEEFLIALIDGDIANAFSKAEVIRQAIEKLDVRAPDGKPIPITASFGVAAMGLNLEQGHQKADKALYQAKHQGRNQVVNSDSLDTNNQ